MPPLVVAWFSPLPPSTSGIAAYSAEVLPLLAARGHTIETFTERNAHDFVWKHRRRPYHLTVFQLGNAECHDYMWAYLFRYPGLVVLHDAQLHQARALFLTRRWQPRLEDYKAEVRANHPEAPEDLPYLILARMGDRMYQHWPMVRLVVERAKMTLVHNAWVADDLQRTHPHATVRAIEMGVKEPVHGSHMSDLRARHGIPEDAFLLGAFGGITPEKRIPQVIRAIAAIAERHPTLHLMLVGTSAEHYDVMADAAVAGVADRVHVTGFVADDDLPGYLAVADVCACLRWPTNRETSASWLRAIAAARPTLVTELAHLGHQPTLDPRGWRLLNTTRERRAPIAVSIDPLDEEHSLQLALERLVDDTPLRDRLGRAAREWWQTHHRLESMAEAYGEIMTAAAAGAVPSAQLPPHLVDDGSAALHALTRELRIADPLSRSDR
jgi:glycosyltransferase involved in cell wall biosynthesis